MKAVAITLTAMGLCASHGVFAQDRNVAPSEGTVALIAQFEPDPRIAMVMAGGRINVSDTVPACSGFISSRPLIRLKYASDPSPAAMPLFIHAFSLVDTTILVNAPDGRWYCNDDGFNGQNPMLIFSPAMKGEYEIWLGTHAPGKMQSALVAFSEVGTNISDFETQLTSQEGR